MTATESKPRINQRHRTRKDLLRAAARLLQHGRQPTMDEVAAEAMVSRATAYRYFPSLEALLAEAPLDGEVPSAEQVFAGGGCDDPEERIDRAEAALHAMIYRNRPQLRRMLAHWLQQSAAGDGADAVPRRQNRRRELIEAALAPARDRFKDPAYERLCAALSLIFGTEAMVVFTDVEPLEEATARSVKSWAARALVRAALQDSNDG